MTADTLLPDTASDQPEGGLDEELRFIAEWENGTWPLPATIIRARQIYRAHPWVINR